VDSVRGPGGGYCLSKEAAQITVADIICAVDEPIDATQCSGRQDCHDDGPCMTHDLWTDLNRTIYAYLRSVTLGDLLSRYEQAKTGTSVIAEPVRQRNPASAWQ